ncbi:putative membrane protein [Clostridioides difficile Y312]|nr:putative membrane protein [Clostridioides difficile Y171]EQI32355.1 putative membrane protein [Clostridioides difficile Y171]EQI63011.1 putative membrane protein [Clostridioides difficile Y312]EQI63028.1 putative membrane protein [Clostridioides difficile Y312]
MIENTPLLALRMVYLYLSLELVYTHLFARIILLSYLPTPLWIF